jgi:hypothetical protein
MQATTLERPERNSVTPSQPARRRLEASRTFYLAATVLLLAAVVIGFWPTYFERLLTGTPLLRPMVKVHAPVFLGWMILLLAQTALVLVGRVHLHRKLGWAWGMPPSLSPWGC